MMDRTKRALPAAVLALAMTVGATTAQADTRNARFEPPAYALGTVHNQQGWVSYGASGSGTPYDHRVASVSSFPGVPASTFAQQALRISNAVTSNALSDQTFSMETPNEAGEPTAANDGLSGGIRQRFFEASWVFMSATPSTEQAGLRVVVSPTGGGSSGQMSEVQMLDSPGGIDVNFLAPDGAGSFPAPTPVAADLPRTVPHTIRIRMEFVPGADNDIVEVYVDGVLRHTGDSWEQFYRAAVGVPTHTVDSLLFRTSGAAAPSTAGFGFLFDDVTVSTPEALTDPANGAVGPQGTPGATGPAGPTGATGPSGALVHAPLQLVSGTGRFNATRRTVSVQVMCPRAADTCEGRMLLRRGRSSAGKLPFLVTGTGARRAAVIPVDRRTAQAIKRGQTRRLSLSVFSRDGSGKASEVVRSIRVARR